MGTFVHNRVASLTWRMVDRGWKSRGWPVGLLVLRVILLRERGHEGRNWGLGVHWTSSCSPTVRLRRGLEPHPVSVWRVIAPQTGSLPFPVETISSFLPAPRLHRHAKCLSCAISCTMAVRSPTTTTTSLVQVSPPISPNPTRTAVKLPPRMSPATLPLSSSNSPIS